VATNFVGPFAETVPHDGLCCNQGRGFTSVNVLRTGLKRTSCTSQLLIKVTVYFVINAKGNEDDEDQEVLEERRLLGCYAVWLM
jgi:hypothetical protein